MCVYVSGNRPTDLGPSCDPEVACEPALALLSHSLGAPGGKPVKLGLTQSPQPKLLTTAVCEQS